MQSLQQDQVPREQEWRILTMLVLPQSQSKASVTELFTAADFHSV